MLQVEGLTKYFSSGLMKKRYVKAVDDVSFNVDKGKTLGFVGESGCGKTTVGRLIMRLIEPTAGKVLFDGIDLIALNRKELRNIRPRMQMIFQDPDSSLDPRMKISASIEEPLRLHGALSRDEREQKVLELVETVGLGKEHIERYPYQLSGGQNQRVVLARILAMNPDLIIADEPTSSLDVSVQAQILNLMKDIQKTFDHSYLFISHDLDVVRIMADHIAVMYLGRLVEIGETNDIFTSAKHPYTQALLSAATRLQPGVGAKAGHVDGIILKGDTPSPLDIPSGCRFHMRCPHQKDVCLSREPESIEVEAGHFVACHFV
jgi:peptide/nickel transport system ATP-binding protein/oligopeptide transport system ATP-binding protein